MRTTEGEARRAGIRRGTSVTLEAVERRRVQLWMVMSTLLVGLSLVIVITSTWPRLASYAVVRPEVLRLSMLGLSVGFSAYVLEKERSLHRLGHLLVEERVLRGALASHTWRLHSLVEAGRSVGGRLDLERVLGVLVQSARELFHAELVAVHLATGSRLEVAAMSASDAGVEYVPRELAASVMRDRRAAHAVLIAERLPGGTVIDQLAIAAPMVNRGELLGVLEIRRGVDREFADAHVSALEALADHAATAIAQVRLYESERLDPTRPFELASAASEFEWLATHAEAGAAKGPGTPERPSP